MNYQKIYDDICKRGQERILPKEVYTEKHHIIPKCLGGDNSKENLTVLTAREHFLAHEILTRIYPENRKLWYAFWRICKMENPYQERHKPSSRIYEEVRSKISKYQSEKVSGEGNPMYGKLFSEEHHAKLREKRKQRVGKFAPNFGKTLSNEWRLALSAAGTGEKNSFYGKSHTDSTKKILREKALLRPSYTKKPLIDENGIIYESRRDFMKKTGFCEQTMYKMFKLNKLKDVCKS